mmetsp:Transcript_9260/g.13531  ORF Transcript_9260/g.13531 Transcript_9260/m.13531 type:complete len:106 (-) Transcript_9260:487-804(-)
MSLLAQILPCTEPVAVQDEVGDVPSGMHSSQLERESRTSDSHKKHWEHRSMDGTAVFVEGKLASQESKVATWAQRRPRGSFENFHSGGLNVLAYCPGAPGTPGTS